MAGVVISLDGLRYEPSGAAESLKEYVRPALETYLTAVFQNAIGRNPSIVELKDCVDRILNGESRKSVILDVLYSPERAQKMIEDTFRRLLSRSPRQEERVLATKNLNETKSLDFLIRTLLGSAEFYAKTGGTIEGFANSLGHELYLRVIDPDTLEAWTTDLRSGTPRHVFLDDLFTSPRYRSSKIRKLYLELVKHEPDYETLAYWMEQLTKGTSLEEIQAGILSADSFFSKAIP